MPLPQTRIALTRGNENAVSNDEPIQAVARDVLVLGSVKLDDHLVVTAEYEGMRTLARLDRPKVGVLQEDLPGASCIWNRSPRDAGHRDLVRLRPGGGVALTETLRAIVASAKRPRGGGLEIRGAADNLARETDFLSALGGRQNFSLPRALMARHVNRDAASNEKLPAGCTVSVADDSASLLELRAVVGESFANAPAGEADPADVEADFFHAPGVLTYVAVRDPDGRVISTGSILISNGVANVWSVATSPSARGQGAATAIMRALCAEAARKGATAATLRTTDDLARPGGLYDNVGFTLLGHEHIWQLDAVDRLDLP